MKKLRDQIAAELEKVTEKTAENVYQAIQTEEGYKNVEERIIKMMYEEGISASACIAHINREM